METLSKYLEATHSMEVVGAQSRFAGQEWAPCSIEHHQMVKATPSDWPDYETRLIYALKPSPCQPSKT